MPAPLKPRRGERALRCRTGRHGGRIRVEGTTPEDKKRRI